MNRNTQFSNTTENLLGNVKKVYLQTISPYESSNYELEYDSTNQILTSYEFRTGKKTIDIRTYYSVEGISLKSERYLNGTLNFTNYNIITSFKHPLLQKQEYPNGPIYTINIEEDKINRMVEEDHLSYSVKRYFNCLNQIEWMEQFKQNGEKEFSESYAYDSLGNILKVVNSLDIITIFEYSNFDSYGNWLKCIQMETTSRGKYEFITVRRIEYF